MIFFEKASVLTPTRYEKLQLIKTNRKFKNLRLDNHSKIFNKLNESLVNKILFYLHYTCPKITLKKVFTYYQNFRIEKKKLS